MQPGAHLLRQTRETKTAPPTPSSQLSLIRLFQPKRDILGVAEPNTTTAGGDLKQPDKHKPTRSSHVSVPPSFFHACQRHWNAPLAMSRQKPSRNPFGTLGHHKDFFLLFRLRRLPRYMRGVPQGDGEIRDGRSERNRAAKVSRSTRRIGFSLAARESPSGAESRC